MIETRPPARFQDVVLSLREAVGRSCERVRDDVAPPTRKKVSYTGFFGVIEDALVLWGRSCKSAVVIISNAYLNLIQAGQDHQAW